MSWEKLFSAKSSDCFRSVREVPSGGYIAAGYTADSSVNDTDAFVVRLTLTGDTLWTFKYNGPLSLKDLFYKVIPCSDGGFAFCGYSNSLTGLSDDAIFMKLDSSGQMEWVKYWGGSGVERAQDIIQLPNGNFVIVGYTSSPPAGYYDAFLLIADSAGNITKSRTYGGLVYDDANSVQYLADGGFILGGQSNNGASTGLDMFLIRLNANCDTLWTRKIGTVNLENAECVVAVNDGYILAGSRTIGANSNAYLVKTDTNGVVVWSKMYGGINNDDFHSIRSTSDGGLIICGTTGSFGNFLPSIWLFRTNASGDSLWARIYGGDNHDHGYYVQQTLDGGFVLAGHARSFGYNYEDAIVIKTDSMGNCANRLKYASATNLLSPVEGVCGGPNTEIKVVIKNFGEVSFQNTQIVVEISGAINTILTETFSGNFSPGETDTVTFSSPINTEGAGTYTFKCYTQILNDVYPEHNSYTTTLFLEGYTQAPVGTDQSRCGTGSLSLSATAAAKVYWYSQSSGGILLDSGNVFNTSLISATTTYYAQSGFKCPSVRTPVIATITSTAPDPVTTSGNNCGPGIIALTASVTQDTIRWYDAPAGGNLVDTGSILTTALLNTTTTYYAEAGSGTCLTNRVPAVAEIYILPADPVTASGNNCGPGIVILSASSTDSVKWYDAPGGNVVGSITNFITPYLLNTTTYYVQSFNYHCVGNFIPAIAEIFIPPAVNLGNDTILSTAPSFPIDAGPGFRSYAWSTGDTAQILVVNFSDTFCVSVIDTNNCIATDCISVQFFIGLTPLADISKLQISPNPSTGIFSITLPQEINSAAIDLKDLNGKIVKSTFSGGKTIFETTDLAKGVYFLQVRSDRYFEVKRILVQ